jgi:hypothetical protein
MKTLARYVPVSMLAALAAFLCTVVASGCSNGTTPDCSDGACGYPTPPCLEDAGDACVE